MKVLALHLTKPSNSEANVVANLLRNLGGDIDVKLLVNQRGASDRDSFFTPLVAVPRVSLCPVDAGLPIDPQAPRPLLRRLSSRAHHLLRRVALLRLADRFSSRRYLHQPTALRLPRG